MRIAERRLRRLIREELEGKRSLSEGEFVDLEIEPGLKIRFDHCGRNTIHGEHFPDRYAIMIRLFGRKARRFRKAFDKEHEKYRKNEIEIEDYLKWQYTNSMAGFAYAVIAKCKQYTDAGDIFNPLGAQNPVFLSSERLGADVRKVNIDSSYYVKSIESEVFVEEFSLDNSVNLDEFARDVVSNIKKEYARVIGT